MTTETTTAPALEAAAADSATDLSALTTVMTATADEPASTDQHDHHDHHDHHEHHDDSNDTSSDQEPSKKRSSSVADLKDGAPPAKVTKRRAARACVSCRARKVRCDVVEGAPCGNCRWDNVECVVQESRRRKKNLLTASTAVHPGAEAQLRSKGTNPVNIHSSAELRRPSNASVASVNGSVATNPVPVTCMPLGTTTPAIGAGAAAVSGIGPGVLGGLSVPGGSSDGLEGHVPHMLYQRSGYRHDSAALLTKLQSAAAAASADSNSRRLLSNLLAQASLFGGMASGDGRTSQFLASLEEPDLHAQLPPFVKPLPAKIAQEDVTYLHAKGALTLPTLPLQNALLQAYIEFVHPYMPLLELYDFLAVINAQDGLCGQISLFLYQAVMFAATAFVDMKVLREAGYPTRKAARKAFFQKTRLLYDFDYESDRLVLVQALLLMTYWYETPDDQKDTWHWMGVAISLAHTIGLHRDPAATSMPVRKQKLWKRIWWSCFMRDRLIALGMRRPTRIKDEDFDVPMLQESDFELEVLPEENKVVPAESMLLRDVSMQRELAALCISKAQLCICISHMLKAQYSVLIRDKMRPENTVNSTMMLFPNKKLDNVESVTSVDLELMAWADTLPAICQYRPLTPLDVKNGRSTVAVQRTLLHMVYYTTISALHRPQFLPSSPIHAPTTSRQVQEMSRLRVRDAAMHVTRMAAELHQLRLERFLPTTGVTVILPAMIIHLLEMKNPVSQSRDRATRGFRQCMRVMEKLREIYAAADYATGFLDAALRKAAIDINLQQTAAPMTQQNLKLAEPTFGAQTPPPDNMPYMTSGEALFAHKPNPQRDFLPQTINAAALDLSATSPPQTEKDHESALGGMTPSASGSSEEPGPLDLEFLQTQEEIDWNAMTGTEFDVDQWLQFPPEGVNNTDEGFMTNVFGEESMSDAMKWAATGTVQNEGEGAAKIATLA
ncbi:Fungal specific transcription factor domain-containing protein [Colletotrichum higginsianum IMI 349063]|uniref:Fungal specific transcription factor domain-containing protein n=4 Tax=Colletotrichum higginsianum TaxID=80884 RepID=A0A1B7YIG5_COLHI|nr:Fungal specific transcription factor domain-containing protein [Colletotrichum higginsianum IMI 349063]OBR11795.1 Fungal specific transcription factor domain-containing protein [Colletotrichum higginsianum IMI 349063]TIC99929.1 Cutinase transcription factor 1 beta [Colletotrichum higginsianum]